MKPYLMFTSLRRGAALAGAGALLALAAQAQPYETPPPPAEPRELRIGAPIEQT